MAKHGFKVMDSDIHAAFLEGSCSWVPWWLWSLDERVEKFGDDERKILGDNCARFYNLA